MNELEKQNASLQAMMFYLLQEIGEPVVVPKSTMEQDIPDNLIIDVDLDETGEAFVFQIVKTDE